ncbi:MAG: UvrD-helicase domain-containing protein [Myxococcales bacterium]|nr:UvrD-helicase domain-containing protein [Myxococcales bacterium]USN51481.1 MAG: UvrD-helicase domain-containing protein [Myxococcales bacterium]
MNKNFFHIATLASAGTGKTYSLVENYLSALFGLDESGIKKRPAQILALTFTQKAANEMRIRIARRLGMLLVENNCDDPLVLLAQEKGIKFPKNEEIKLILRALPNAPIATFHAFCSSLLKQEASSLAMLGNFDILEPSQEYELAKNIVRSILIAKIAKDKNLKNLVARFRLSSGMRSAGLIEGILNLYFKLFEKGVSPSDIPYYAKNHKLSLSHIEHSFSLLKGAYEKFSEITLTKTAQLRLEIIKEKIKLFENCLSDPHEQTCAHAFQELRESVKGNFGNSSLRKNLVEKTLKLGALLVDYFVMADENTLMSLVIEFHEIFANTKLQIMKFSYSDLLVRVRDALRDNLSFRQKVKERFKHVMVDEYQDTSPLQEQIIALLCENKNDALPLGSHEDALMDLDFRQGSSLFVVGDKKQSIYGFRGADTSLFDRMLKKMQDSHTSSDAHEKRILKTNYRSSSEVINLVNKVSRQALRKQSYSQDDDLLVHKSKNLGKALLWVSDSDQEMPASMSNLFCAAHGIAQLLKERPDLSAKDITVLVRRIKSAAVIKSQLHNLGINSRIVGGEGFFQQQEVIDILSALKLLNDPCHSIALLTVLRSLLVLIQDQEILSMLDENNCITLMSVQKALDEQRLSKKSAERLSIFLEALKEIKSNLYKNSLLEAVNTLIERTDFSFSLGFYPNANQRLANVYRLRSMLTKGHDNFVKKIEDFYQKITDDLSEPLAPDATSEDVVSIMTIHQSKGLEFKVVVLADSESAQPNDSDEILFDKKLGFRIKAKQRAVAVCAPTASEKDCAATAFDQIKLQKAKEEKEQNARLLYVALTRAQEEIYVAASRAAVDAEKKSHSLLNIFLSSLDQKDEFQRKIVFDTRLLAPTVKLALLEDNVGIYRQEEKSRRIFSSNLKAPAYLDFHNLIDRKIYSSFKHIDGNCAHSIMAEVGAQLVTLEHVEHEALRQLIDASVRALGPYENQDVLARTQEACFYSLLRLHEILKNSMRSIFEMPLSSMPVPGYIIEGFADLVVENNDFIGVIEFKSSYRLATHPDTYLQTLAYAKALEEFAKPLRFAVLLIGAQQPIKWQEFNHDYEKLLLDALDFMANQAGHK